MDSLLNATDCYRNAIATQIGVAVKEFERTPKEADYKAHLLLLDILRRYEVASRLIQVKDPRIAGWQEYRWAVETVGSFIVDPYPPSEVSSQPWRQTHAPSINTAEYYLQRWQLVARYGDLTI